MVKIMVVGITYKFSSRKNKMIHNIKELVSVLHLNEEIIFRH